MCASTSFCVLLSDYAMKIQKIESILDIIMWSGQQYNIKNVMMRFMDGNWRRGRHKRV